jgi:carboxymethylenebutenolidase
MTRPEGASSSDGIPVNEVTFPSASGKPMRAALARPNGDAARPAVIVIHEVFGLNDDIREKAARIASMGYVALAPDLFDRPSPKPICIARTMRQLGRGQGEAFDDLEAAREWLAGQSFVEEDRVGVIGFCMGGGFALLFAARAPLNAAAVFYGAVPKDTAVLREVCPVVASYGARDRMLRSAPGKLRRALQGFGVEHDVKTYDGAGHSFMSDHRGVLARVSGVGPMKIGFHPAAAEDSWKRVNEFFAKHL